MNRNRVQSLQRHTGLPSVDFFTAAHDGDDGGGDAGCGGDDDDDDNDDDDDDSYSTIPLTTAALTPAIILRAHWLLARQAAVARCSTAALTLHVSGGGAGGGAGGAGAGDVQPTRLFHVHFLSTFACGRSSRQCAYTPQPKVMTMMMNLQLPFLNPKPLPKPLQDPPSPSFSPSPAPACTATPYSTCR